MPTDVTMPQMGESIFEGTLTKWLKKVGDTVARDEPLFEISTDKVDAEIPAPSSGVLSEIKVQEGATVQVNTVVATISGESASAPGPPTDEVRRGGSPTMPAQQPPTPSSPQTASAQPAAKPPEATPSGVPAPPRAMAAQQPPAAGTGTEVTMPQMGESIFEGTLTKWLKKVGDKVARDEPLFEISTDKVDAEIPAPSSGTLSEIKVQEGATVQVNTVVALISSGESATAQAASGVPAPPRAVPAQQAPSPSQSVSVPEKSPPQASPSTAAQTERLRSSPLVRKIAKDNSIDLHQLSGTGNAGRITKDDILGFIAQNGKTTLAQGVPAPPRATAAQQPPTAPTPGDLVPMSKMRSIIAKRMAESKHTSAHVHTVFKVDMTRIVKIREREKNKFEQRNGVKLTYMPFITRAVLAGIKAMPIVNTSVEGESIRYHKNVNIGIAVALDWGLIVPVVKQVEEKSFLGIQRAINDVAERARNKKLQPDEVSGGTFTITNPGIFGPQFGTPIINQPQVAILGMGGLFKEPVVITDKDGNDSIAIRSIIRLTLGYDHRIIDGADADKFMVVVRNYLENWSEDIG